MVFPHQVGNDPLEPPTIGDDPHAVSLQAHPALPLPRANHRGDQGLEIQGLTPNGLHARVQPRYLHKVLDEPPKASDLCEEQLGRTAMLCRQVVHVALTGRGPRWARMGGVVRYRTDDVRAWLLQEREAQAERKDRRFRRIDLRRRSRTAGGTSRRDGLILVSKLCLPHLI